MTHPPIARLSALVLYMGLTSGLAQAVTEAEQEERNAAADPAEQASGAGQPAQPPAAADAQAGPGITTHGLVLRPKIALGMRFDDNIYATADNEIDDLVVTLSPSLEAQSDWQRHALNLSAGANIARYQDYATENTEDYWLDIKGRYDLAEGTNLFGGARHAYAHESRESADELAAAAPTTYSEDVLYAGIQQRFASRFGLRLGGSYRQLDYDNVPNQINDDRDREVLTGAARLGYAMGNGYQWFAQASLDQRRYRLALDDNGDHRDSSGYRLQTGVQWQHGPWRGDAYVGHMGQDYDDHALRDVSAVDFGASMNWQASPQTTWHVAVERSIEETTLAGASSYLWTTLSAGVSHKLRPDLSITGSIGMMEADYQGDAREDDFIEAALGLKYELNRHSYLATSYRFLERDSNDDTVDFDRNQLSLLLGWQF